jgi:hypothetical protein
MAKGQGQSGDGGDGGGITPKGAAILAGAAGILFGGGLIVGAIAGAGTVAGPAIVGGILVGLGIGAIAGAGIGVFGGGSGFGGTIGGGCFVEGTEVLMADGTHKSIERIAVNDLVLSRHEKTGVVAGRRVSRVFVHDVASVLNLTLASGETIGTTEAHRFALGIGNFSPAKSIGVGARMCTEASTTEVLRRELVPGRVRVHNFTVEEFNTYFVGHDRVWVHNLKKGDPSEPSEGDGDP